MTEVVSEARLKKSSRVRVKWCAGLTKDVADDLRRLMR
jgi:hypothetical protein